MENVGTPDDYIPELLNRVKPEYLLKTYHIAAWEDHEDFLEQVAKRYGKLLKVCSFFIHTIFFLHNLAFDNPVFFFVFYTLCTYG